MSVTTAVLVDGLPECGIDLHLIDTADRRGLRNVGRLDVRNVVNASRHGARFVQALARVRPDVVYVPIAQNSLGFLRDALFLLPARLSGTKVVVHLHGCAFQSFFATASPMMRFLVRLALKDVTAAIVLGEAALGQFDGLVPRSRVHVVPNGLPDVARAGDDGRAARLDRGEGVVLYLGALALGKGFVDLLRAIALLDDLPGLRFVFAGEFTTAAAEREAAQVLHQLDQGPRVELLGSVDATAAQRLLSEAAALVLPARQVEGQPLVILEAFRAGTPVVATPSGCIGDTVRDGCDGFLVASDDPEGIARALRSLTADVDRWAKMSAAARRSYESRYRSQRWIADMAAVLRRAAAGPAVPVRR